MIVHVGRSNSTHAITKYREISKQIYIKKSLAITAFFIATNIIEIFSEIQLFTYRISGETVT